MLPEAGLRSSSARAASGIVHACLPHAVLGSSLHFGGLGRPRPSRLSDRDSGRCQYQSANAGVGTHARVIMDVSSELGCLLLRFCHARSILESVRPRRVVRIVSSGPKSGWGRGADPRVGAPERRLGGGRPSCSFARRASCLLSHRPAARACRRLCGPCGVLGRPVGPICVQNDRPTRLLRV